MSVSKLAYMGVNASDLPAWKSYAADVLGLEVAPDSSDRRLYLRADERHHRIAVHSGDANDVEYIGWEVANHEALESMAGILDRNKIKVVAGRADELAERRILEMVRFTCPFTGARIELSVGNEAVFKPGFRPARELDGFLTGDLGMGHFVLYVKENVEAAAEFYVRNLGFGISDWVVSPEGRKLAAFFHCNKRHHSMALIQYPPAPRKIQHVFFETRSIDDVGTTYDVCAQRKISATTIGRHPNDRSISFYFRNPSRWFFEYGWQLRTIDPKSHTTEQYVLKPGIGWGHEGLKTLEDQSH